MARTLIGIPFALVLALIVRAEGTFNFFTVWNCLPVVLGYVALLGGIQMRGPHSVAVITGAMVATLFSAIFHLAWLFDWGRTATGSSTSALAFIFVPIWAFILAAVMAIVAWGIAYIVQRLLAMKTT
jgi:hypothetical protein